MFQLWPVISFTPLVVKGHTVSHWKALRDVKYEPKGLKWHSTFNICRYVLKRTNQLHKQDFLDCSLQVNVFEAAIYCKITKIF